MFSTFRARFSSAHLIAGVAIFLVLGGSAFAAKKLITGKQIKDGTVTQKDLSKSTVSALKGQQGPTGATGATGATGPAGADAVIAPLEESVSNSQNINADTTATVITLNVPSGSYVVNAKANVFSSGTAIANCELRSGANGIDDSNIAGPAAGRTGVPLMAVAPAGTTQLSIRCAADSTGINIGDAKIIAIPVG